LDPRNLAEEGKKREEICGQKRGGQEYESSDYFLKKESMCSSVVLKRTEKQIVFGYKNLLGNVFQSKLINEVARK
jgi:hypothetical protein